MKPSQQSRCEAGGRPHFRTPGSDLLQVLGRALAALWTALLFVGNLLAFVQRAEAGALDGGNMYKHIRSTAFRLNEAVPLGAIEPLHSTDRHRPISKLDCRAPPDAAHHTVSRI